MPLPLRFLLVPASLAFCAQTVVAQNVPTGFTVDVLVQSGLQQPIDFSFLPDGRAVIVGKTGELSVCANFGQVATSTLGFVGTVPAVEVNNERGMLSVAADPAFASNGYVYVWYSSTADAFMHLDRFTLNGDRGLATSTNLQLDLASRRPILDAVPDNWEEHNGGSLRFGLDGTLFVSIGDDEFGACDAQSTTSSLGCILRMDVAGVPAGGSASAPSFAALNPGNNPFSSASGVEQLVVAIGLRNPFRMEIDSLTGNLYIGDVGGVLHEEVNEYVSGSGVLPLRNFGWPWIEGSAVQQVSCSGSVPPGADAPIWSGDHGSGWGVIIQGPRYRNQNGPFDFGPAYEGSIFAQDYYGGWMRRVVDNNGWVAASPVPGQPTSTDWATQMHRVTSMRQGPDGAIYMTQDVPWWAGLFTRIRPSVPAATLTAALGSGQIAVTNEAFAQPVVARVTDGTGAPQSGVPVDFSVFGPGTIVTPMPVATNAQGEARVFLNAANGGGPIRVTASAPGAQGRPTFDLFARKIAVANTTRLAVVTITNQATVIPAQVPYVVMVALPWIAPWQSPFGPICTDPSSPLTIIIEDSLGIFGGVSLSGAGSIGSPGLTRVYQLVPGLLNGLQLNFQAIGLDPVAGLFRTDCVTAQF